MYYQYNDRGGIGLRQILENVNLSLQQLNYTMQIIAQNLYKINQGLGAASKGFI